MIKESKLIICVAKLTISKTKHHYILCKSAINMFCCYSSK
uniref:Uncharacterized protein n=1 Tax=Anguilla anguilla TaxID=7936 RepID=A0A0E9VP68_ANGAN